MKMMENFDRYIILIISIAVFCIPVFAESINADSLENENVYSHGLSYTADINQSGITITNFEQLGVDVDSDIPQILKVYKEYDHYIPYWIIHCLASPILDENNEPVVGYEIHLQESTDLITWYIIRTTLTNASGGAEFLPPRLYDTRGIYYSRIWDSGYGFGDYSIIRIHEQPYVSSETAWTNDIESEITIHVYDSLRNLHPDIQDPCTVLIESFDSSEDYPIGTITLPLTEKGLDAPLFEGTFDFTTGESYDSHIKVTDNNDGYFRITYENDNYDSQDTTWTLIIPYQFYSSIKGRIFKLYTNSQGNPSIKPMVGVPVWAHSNDELIPKNTITDDNAYFEFEKVPPGLCTISTMWGMGACQESYNQEIIVQSGSDILVIFPEDLNKILMDKEKAWQDYWKYRGQLDMEHALFLRNKIIALPVTALICLYLPHATGYEIATIIDVIAVTAIDVPANLAIDYVAEKGIGFLKDSQIEELNHLYYTYRDPPDSNYNQLYIPDIPDLMAFPPGYDGIMSQNSIDFMNGLATHAALEEAILRSYERYQGALLTGDFDAASLQLQAVNEYTNQLDANRDELAVAIANLRNELIAGQAEHGGEVIDFQARLAQDGFSPEEEQSLRDMGFEDDDLEAYKQFLIDLAFNEGIASLDMIDEVSESREEAAIDLTENITEMQELYLNFPSDFFILHDGWNFISIPNSLSDGNNTALIFDEVDTADQPIYSYDAESGTWIQITEDTTLHPFDAYWIYSRDLIDIPLYYDKDPIHSPLQKHLLPGWNAIGPPSVDNIPVNTVLSTISGKWVYVLPFNNEVQQYEQAIVHPGADSMLEPGHGYWIYMKEEGDIVGFGV